MCSFGDTVAIAVNQVWAGHPGRLVMEGGPRFSKPWHCPGNSAYWGKCCVDTTRPDGCSVHSPNCKSEECTIASWQVWAKAMPDGGLAAIVINRSEKTVTGISVPWSALGLRSGVLARDVWMGNDLGPMKTEAWNIAELASHDSVFLRFFVQN